MLQIIYNYPGFKTPVIHSKLLIDNPAMILNQIRIAIKIKISSYIKYRGSRKTGDMTLKMR